VNTHAIMKLVSFIAILVLAFIVVTSDVARTVINGDIDGLREMSSDNLLQMLMITFVAMLLQNLFTVIPLILLATINVAMFGIGYGYLWTWLSSVAAALIVFLLTRYWLQSWLMRKVNESIKERIARYGMIYVLVCRIIPVMPSSLINMAAGASTIRFTHFFIGTLVGNLLFMSVLAGVTVGFMEAAWEAAMLVAAVVALGGLLLFLQKRRFKRRVMNPDKNACMK
jgi:Uncharacterized conserved protein